MKPIASKIQNRRPKKTSIKRQSKKTSKIDTARTRPSTSATVSALGRVFSKLFSSKDTFSDEELLIEKEPSVSKNHTPQPKKNVIKHSIMRLLHIPITPKTLENDQNKFENKCVEPSTSLKASSSSFPSSASSHRLLSENFDMHLVHFSEMPESLKNEKNKNSLTSASEEMSPPSYSSCWDSHQFQTEDRVMHLMNFPPKTIGSEQSTYAEPLIRRVKVSAPRHLSSRNSNKLPSEDNIMHLFNFKKKPKPHENEQKKCTEPIIRGVKDSAPSHFSSLNSHKMPDEDSIMHLFNFKKKPKPHENEQKKCTEPITTRRIKVSIPSHKLPTNNSISPSVYPSKRSTAAKIDETFTSPFVAKVTISNTSPDEDLMNSEGFKPDQVKLMFKNHYVEDIETPDSLGMSNGDCVKVFF